MIISPPFLPAVAGHEMDSAGAGDTLVPDHDVCAAGMQECAPGNGAYPVSFNLGWHGGVHLIAPRDAHGNAERVRAIADGTVVYVRKTAAAGTAALSYRGVRTDDGCVVIKHTTEIGEGNTAKVTFFSIYMHLQTVQALVVGKKIYRKDVLGVAGSIYGQRGQIHFEIVCDDANLKNLVGRMTGPLTAANGRKDAIYGDIWFKVPRGTLIFQNEPHPNRLDDQGPPPCAYAGIQPQAGAPTAVEYVIRMRYERGNCTLTAFQQQADGSYAEVGASPVSQGYEYGLYEETNRLHAKYFELNQAAGCAYAVVPSPSVIYEILRFGRVVGPDAIPPYAKFGHWRKVKTPDAKGWINLHSPEIGVYSDADFPHWAGWSLIDDDVTSDSRCDSPTILRWLDLDGDGEVTHTEAVEALPLASTQKRLSKAICKFPAEWSRHSEIIKHRWGWLTKASKSLPAPLEENDFLPLMEHIQALSFWEDVQDVEFPAAESCWHFPPKAFVACFRKCGYLSTSEIIQIIPHATIENVERFKKSINLVSQKYLFCGKVRFSHFIGQVAHETGDLHGAMVEFGNTALSKEYETAAAYYTGPDTYSYFLRSQGYERLQNVLGNEYNSGDGVKFRGRGALQITGRAGYAKYWLYRGWLEKSSFDENWWQKNGWWSVPRNQSIRPARIDDPQRISARVSGNEFNPLDVAGWFWTSHRINITCDPESPTSTLASRSIAVSQKINFYDGDTFPARQRRTERAKKILCDAI